jgi:catechol 2,3-dioxygenase-like lactoylglutathione lyase family enzyme
MAAESPYGKFFRLGYVTRDIAAASHRMIVAFGLRQLDLPRPPRCHDGKNGVVSRIAHFAVGGIELELIEPRLDCPSPYVKALPADPGACAFHHVGYLVNDKRSFDQAIGHAAAAGAPVAFSCDTTNALIACIDTRALSGHCSEIVLPRVPLFDTAMYVSANE